MKIAMNSFAQRSFIVQLLVALLHFFLSPLSNPIKKIGVISLLFLSIHQLGNAQLFQQTFSSGGFTPDSIFCSSGGVVDGTTYRSSITPSNSQFTYINTSTGSSCGTGLRIDNGKLKVVKTANNAYLTRTVPFSPSPSALLVRFDFQVVSNSSSNTSAFNFYIGDGIADNNSSGGWAYHSNFKIGVFDGGSLGWRVNSTGSYVYGSHTVLMAVNNSGGILTYYGPDGSCESVGDDKYDVWIDNIRYVNDAAAINGAQGLNKFAFVSNSGPASTCTFDNILIDPIPTAPVSNVYTPLVGAGIGFIANWTPVAGVTGYNVDLSTDPVFPGALTSTRYVAGAATSSFAFDTLRTGILYYYRVRSANVYTVGVYQSCSSTTQTGTSGESLSISTQPVGYSACLGSSNTLSVTSSNAISYQWFVNTVNSNSGGTPIAGATNPTYTPPSSPSGTFYYYCVLTRGSSLLASNVAIVELLSQPTLTSVSLASPVCGGFPATLNLSGLVPSNTNTVYYHIGAGGPLSATNVIAAANGTASFQYTPSNADNNATLFIDSIRSACLSIFNNISTVLQVFQSPSSPTGGVTVNGCSAGTMTLSVNNPGGSFFTNWYSAATGGVLLTSSSNTYTTPSFSNDTTVTYYAQTISSSGGCSSPRVAVVGSLVIPDFNLNNNIIYNSVPIAPFTVNLPYSFATGGLDRYDITWTGTTAGVFANVTNAVLPASPVVLQLNSSAIAGTYTGNIRVRNSTTGCVTAQIPFTLVIIPVATGDYGSIATGVWTATTTWRRYNPLTGTFSDAVTTPPTSTTNIWIIGGFTVTAATGGSCNELHVLNGRLISNTSVAINQSIAVSGNVIEVAASGYIGNGNSENLADGISFNISGATPNTTVVIKGLGGTINISRFIIGRPSTSIIIDHDMTINHRGTSVVAGTYPFGSGYSPAFYSNTPTSTVTINPGMTVTMSRWANMGLSSLPNTNQSYTFTLNVNGNLTFVPGLPAGYTLPQITFPSYNGYLNMNSNGATSFNINVGATGVLNVVELYTGGITGASTSTNVINIAAGGVVNVDSIADFRKANMIVTGAGTFNLRGKSWMRIGSPLGVNATGNTGHIQCGTRNLSKTARYSFETRGVAQNTGTLLDTVGALIVADTSSTLTLGNNIYTNDSLRLNGGKLVTSNFVISTNRIARFTDTNYVVTTSTGALRLFNIGVTDVFYPVGPTTTAYNPITLSNTGTPDNFRVNVQNTPVVNMNLAPRSDSAVQRSWGIIEDIAGGSFVTLTPRWNAGEMGALFSLAGCSIVHSNGSIVDFASSVGAATGTGPYTKPGYGFSLFTTSDRYGVGSTPKKYRSRQNGGWSEFETWDISNPSGGYSSSEADFPNSNTAEVIIQNTHNVNVLSGNTITQCGNLTLEGILTLSTQPGENFFIAGNWYKGNTGLLTDNGRFVVFNGSNNSTITSFNGQLFPRLSLQKTTSSAKLTLLDSVSISRELNIETGTLDLANKNLTLLSDSSYTASLGKLTASSGIVYSGTGQFIVERYIHTGTLPGQHGKSWQLLCAPVAGQTIKQSWMENAAANQDPNPGYGTQIVGIGGTNNGFDVATASGSIRSYNATTNNWVDLPNTNQPVNSNKGFVLLVRGDRSVITLSGLPKPTKLRSKGTVNFGNITGPSVSANSFQSVANPYPSAIDITTVSRTGLVPFIYVFDPVLSNLYGLGAYQTIDLSTGNATPGGTSYYSSSGDYRNIQSGQAFFVYAGSGGGSINFTENNKTNSSRLATRVSQPTSFNSYSLATQLFTINANQQFLTDGNKVIFNEQYENGVDVNDAKKFINSGENFGVMRSNQILSIETRKPIVVRDTIFYSINLSRALNYKLSFCPNQFNSAMISARLEDKYLHSSTPVDLNDTSYYDFTVNADAASKAADRFMLVLESAVAGPLPVQFVSLNATYKHPSLSELTWTVAQQSGIHQYEVERSVNGKDFITVGVKSPAIDASLSTYQFLDELSTAGVFYYRIKAVDSDGSFTYSNIVKINVKPAENKFEIYPNPAVDNHLFVIANEKIKGKLTYQIFDQSGKKTSVGMMNFSVGKQEKIIFPKGMPSGTYVLKINKEETELESIRFIKK